MCPPIPALGALGAGAGSMILPAALSVAGAVYNRNTQNAAIEEQNRQNARAMQIEAAAREAERVRQRAMEDEQVLAVNQALDKSDPSALKDVVAEAAASPDNEFVTQADEYNADALQGQTSTGEVKEAIGQIIGEQLARTREMLRNQSVLANQGVGFSGMQDAAVRMGSDVSSIGSNRRRSAGVAGMETSIPTATVTPSDSILGDILMIGGKAMAGGMFGPIGGAAANAGNAAVRAAGNPYWWKGIY